MALRLNFFPVLRKSSNLFPSTSAIQHRQYLPKKLSPALRDRLDRVRKPFIPSEAGKEELIEEWQRDPYKVKAYKRRAWAKFGSASGVDPSSLLPNKKEIEEELEAEKEWWPTLQAMQKKIEERKKCKEMKRMEYERKIAENMKKMPQWIKEWEENQIKEKGKAESLNKEKQRIAEMAKEHFGYDLPAHDPKIRKYVADYVEKQREEKKLAKKIAKKLRH